MSTMQEIEAHAVDEIVERIGRAMQSRITWDKIMDLMSQPGFPQEARERIQRIIPPIPKGDIFLASPSRRIVLRPVIGYAEQMRKINNQLHATDELREGLIQTAAWRGTDNLLVSASVNDGKFGPLLHLAISYPDRDPSWEIIKLVRSRFFPPFINCMMVLPREDLYVNVHKHCFHLHQTPSDWDMA